MNTDKILVNRKEASRQLSVSLRTLDYLIKCRELWPVRRIGRRVLIPWRALEDFARRDHRVRADREAGQD